MSGGAPFHAHRYEEEQVSSAAEIPYLLLTKARALEAAEDYKHAIRVLREATPFVKDRDLRLLFSLHFKLVNNLCHLECFAEAQQLLPEVQGLAFTFEKKFDLLRVRWLEGRVAAGVGNLEKAIELLSTVREEFTNLDLAYDAALVAMDLAAVLLKIRRTGQVKALARQMAPIFKSNSVHLNAKKTLQLFLEAAQAESATLALVHRIASYLRRARFLPELGFNADA
jgi:tetratricopeptide (TPR) repeat protein